MGKQKVTINVDKDNWIKFQNWVAIQNTNATQKINEYIESVVSENLPPDYEKRIQDKVFEELDSHISNAVLDSIALSVAFKLGLKIDTVNTVNTASNHDSVNTVSTANTVLPGHQLLATPAANPRAEANQTKGAKQIQPTGTDNQDSTANTVDTAKKESQDGSNKAGQSKRGKVDPGKQTYTDREVSEIESVGVTSVCRYRVKKRFPRDKGFWQRWAVNPANSGVWIRVDS